MSVISSSVLLHLLALQWKLNVCSMGRKSNEISVLWKQILRNRSPLWGSSAWNAWVARLHKLLLFYPAFHWGHWLGQPLKRGSAAETCCHLKAQISICTSHKKEPAHRIRWCNLPLIPFALQAAPARGGPGLPCTWQHIPSSARKLGEFSDPSKKSC